MERWKKQFTTCPKQRKFLKELKGSFWISIFFAQETLSFAYASNREAEEILDKLELFKGTITVIRGELFINQ